MPHGQHISFGVFVANSKLPEYVIKGKTFVDVDLLGPASFTVEEDGQRYPVVPFSLTIRRTSSEVVWVRVLLDGHLISSRPLCLTLMTCDGVKVGDEIRQLLFSLPRIMEDQEEQNPHGQLAGTIRVEVTRTISTGQRRIPVMEKTSPCVKETREKGLLQLTKKDVQELAGDMFGGVVIREGQPFLRLCRSGDSRIVTRYSYTGKVMEEVTLHYRQKSFMVPREITLPEPLTEQQDAENVQSTRPTLANVTNLPKSQVVGSTGDKDSKQPGADKISGSRSSVSVASVEDKNSMANAGFTDFGSTANVSSSNNETSSKDSTKAGLKQENHSRSFEESNTDDDLILIPVKKSNCYTCRKEVIAPQQVKQCDSCVSGMIAPQEIKQCQQYDSCTSDTITLQQIKRRESCASDQIAQQQIKQHESCASNLIALQQIKRRESCASNLIALQQIKRRESCASDQIALQQIKRRESSASDQIALQQIKRRESCALDQIALQQIKRRESSASDQIALQQIKRRESCASDPISEQQVKRRCSFTSEQKPPKLSKQHESDIMSKEESSQEVNESSQQELIYSSDSDESEDAEPTAESADASIIYMGDDECYILDVSNNISVIDLDTTIEEQE